jgi:hypothetical protein
VVVGWLGRGCVDFGRDVDAAGGGATGTSFNWGCVAVSTPARARSRAAESVAAAESIAALSVSLPEQAAKTAAMAIGNTARNRMTCMSNLSSEK